MFTRKIKKWLENMAEKNERQYGNHTPDCCDLNRQSLHEGNKRKTAYSRRTAAGSQN